MLQENICSECPPFFFAAKPANKMTDQPKIKIMSQIIYLSNVFIKSF